MHTRWRIVLFGLITLAAGFLAVKLVSIEQPSPALLRVGVLPDQGETVLRTQYAPFLTYLSATTGFEVRLVLPADYGELIELFRDEALDLAYFGGLTYVQAHARYGVVPLVMRDVDMKFTSSFLVRPADAGQELADFKGKALAFGSPLSTSGHLMPRHFLHAEKQIIPEEFFSEVHYSGTHDATAYLVRDSDVDIGVANTSIINSMFEDGRLKPGDVRVLWQTPPYIDYVWAVRNNLSDTRKTQLRDAFLALNVDNKLHRDVLKSLDAKVFFPAGSGDFLLLEQIADGLGLLDRQK